MLAALWPTEQPVGALVTKFNLSQPIVSQQLAVLRNADLVTVRVDGRRRLYRANPARLADIRTWLETFWDERLDRLAAAVRADGRPSEPSGEKE
jgi:DNA-binding transcriptional ArsR family regulator